MEGFDIRFIMVSFLAIVISLTVHEFAHAWMADKLGDPTPREHGRLTLNPIVLFKAHPFGALLVPLIGAFQGFLIGWAATPVNPRLVRRDITMRKAEFLISFAGPASNLILAVISALLWAAVVRMQAGDLEPITYLLQMMVFANVFLALLNLMPVPPLDGFTVLEALSPKNPIIPFVKNYSLIVLLLVFMYAGHIFRPVMQWTNSALMWLIR
jgi:Zn-dependent protease